MLRQQFLQEIQASALSIHSSGHQIIDYLSNAITSHSFTPEPVKVCTVASHHGEVFPETGSADNSSNPFDNWQNGSIAIIPIQGIMMKYGYWWSYGMDEIAGIIRMAYQSEKISGVIVLLDTPGGSTNSLYLLQEVLMEKTKPTYGIVSGMCASCGYIAASYLDKIYAVNKMALIGSIGVFAQLYIANEDKSYYKLIEVYPDESKEKNLPEREAAQGNTVKLKEELSKLALYFREVVTENRPAIHEETLTGKTYFAYEAETLGLIDGICPISQVVSELENLIKSRNKILSII